MISQTFHNPMNQCEMQLGKFVDLLVLIREVIWLEEQISLAMSS